MSKLANADMMLYHYITMGKWNELRPEDPPESEFITSSRVDETQEAAILKASGRQAWLYVMNPFENRDSEVFKDGWVDDQFRRYEAFKTAGVWETVAGFELEELGGKVTGKQFHKIGAFLHENWPDKRIFACLSYYEASGTQPPDCPVSFVTPETYEFVTDIGFDWYQSADYNEHRALTEKMLADTGRKEELRVWFLPCTYQVGDYADETYMLTHLEMCYRLLREQKNPGGLYCYTWITWFEEGAERAALDRLIAPDGYRYEALAARIREIGRELSGRS